MRPNLCASKYDMSHVMTLIVVRPCRLLLLSLALAAASPAALEAFSGPCPGTRAEMWWFRDVPAFIPLVAEPHADDLKLTFGRLAQYQYARSTGDRWGADFDVGGEIPIVGCLKPKVAGL